jgi:hypothetical protein
MPEKPKEEPIHLIRSTLVEGRMVSYCGLSPSVKALTVAESEATCKNCLKSRAHLRRIEDALGKGSNARTKNH